MDDLAPVKFKKLFWNMIVSKTRSLADRVRADFPALQPTIYGQPAIYLDNTETLQEKNLGMIVLF